MPHTVILAAAFGAAIHFYNVTVFITGFKTKIAAYARKLYLRHKNSICNNWAKLGLFNVSALALKQQLCNFSLTTL